MPRKPSLNAQQKGGLKTASLHRGEEHMLGKCFGKHNYDASYQGPTWDNLLNLLVKEEIGMDKLVAILFCGKAGSDGQVGGTGFGIVTGADIRNALSPFWGGEGQPSGPRAVSTDRNMVPDLAMEVLPLNVKPIHITGIVIREVV